MSGKKIKQMASILAPYFKYIIVSTPGTFKISNPEQVAANFKNSHNAVFLEKNPADALKKALFLSEKKLPVLATGSFYFVAEILKISNKYF